MSVKSLQVIASKKPGGAEYFFTRLSNGLQQAGEPVEVVVSDRCEYLDKLDPNLGVTQLPMKGIWDLYSRFSLKSLVRKHDIDVVQTYLGRAARLTHLNSKDAKLVCRVGGFYNQQQYNHADYWVCNTQGLCDHMVQGGMPASKVFRIPNFVATPDQLNTTELAALRQQYGIAPDELVICSVGRLHKIKGLDTLIQAFARLVKFHKTANCRLLLVGDGPEKDALQTLAETEGIAERIIWAGWQSNPAPFYQLADIAVCSSVQEGFGNVILEAWSNDRPMLSTAAEGPLELIRHGETGLLVPIGAEEEMADQLLTLTRDPTLRASLTMNARQELEAHYTEQAVVTKYIEFYRQIAGN